MDQALKSIALFSKHIKRHVKDLFIHSPNRYHRVGGDPDASVKHPL